MARTKKGSKIGTNPNSRKGMKNLKVIRSEEEARKKGKKGGIASGIARRKQRDTFEWLEKFENSNITKNEAENLRKEFNELKGEEYISQNAVIAFYTMKEARESNNISARRLYYDINGVKKSQRTKC